MATRDELYTALRNADASGDADGARKLAAYIQSMPSDKPKEAPSILGGVNPTEGQSFGTNLMQGLGKAVSDTGLGIRGLLGLTKPGEVEESRRLDAPLMQTGGGVTGNVGGQIGMALAPGGAIAGAGKLAGAVGLARAGNALTGVGRAAMLPESIAGAGAQGAALGAIQPAADMGERGMNALTGAAGGAGGQALFKGASRIISPQTDANVLALMKEGITPTPGQILGGGFKRAEEGLTSVPIVGDAIKKGQRRAVEELNAAAINRTLEPIGESLPKGMTGYDAVKYAGDTLSDRYQSLLPKLDTSMDGQFVSEIQQLRNSIGSGSIDPAKAKQFESLLNDQVLTKFQGPNATVAGQTMKQIDSDLGHLSSQYRSSPDPDQRLLGDALLEVKSILRGNVIRSNPQAAPELKALDTGWANLVRVENAAGMRGAKEGVFSAANLGAAVKATDKSTRKRAVARGEALMQDLAQPAEAVLGSTVPDSGTPFRTLTALGAGGAAGGLIGPGTAAGILAAPVLYSRPGQAALAALLTRRPQVAQPIGNALEQLAPYAGLPAAGYSTQQR